MRFAGLVAGVGLQATERGESPGRRPGRGRFAAPLGRGFERQKSRKNVDFTGFVARSAWPHVEVLQVGSPLSKRLPKDTRKRDKINGQTTETKTAAQLGGYPGGALRRPPLPPSLDGAPSRSDPALLYGRAQVLGCLLGGRHRLAPLQPGGEKESSPLGRGVGCRR